MGANVTKPMRTPMQLVTDDHGTERLYRRCNECRAWKPADREHFYADRNRLRGSCKICKCRAEDANRASALSHAESADAYRAARNAAHQRWRKRNPEKVRAARSIYYHSHREDECARTRIAYRLQAEREGRTVGTRGRRATVAPYRHDNGKRGLDPLPLRLWLDAVLEHEEALTSFCTRVGWQDRQLRAIRDGMYATVSASTAERLLVGYGRAVVIRSRDLERRLIDWAQSLPGNGTRLLAYMDRAEAVGHLADVPILFLADLWPELDE